MARFLHHAPCPRCNSKDNLGVYDDGSVWCFGCSYNRRGLFNPNQKREEPEKQSLPLDLVQEYPLKVIEWILKYNISVAELIKHNVYWSPSKQQLLFLFYANFSIQFTHRDAGGIQPSRLHNRTNTETFACARNFSPGAKYKYHMYGIIEPSWTVYKSSVQSSCLVLVEDCLSAIKIARQSDCKPLLTSTLPAHEIKRLVGLYEVFLVWLDGNKWDNAQKIARKFQFLGKEARAVYSPLDPKEYSDSFIQEVLTNPFKM